LGLGREVQPDDERADQPGRYIRTGLLSMLLLVAAIAGLVLPPALGAGLILRGQGFGRLIGLVLVGGWLAGVLWIGRRLMGAARP
jgi:hypothetical protein